MISALFSLSPHIPSGPLFCPGAAAIKYDASLFLPASLQIFVWIIAPVSNFHSHPSIGGRRIDLDFLCLGERRGRERGEREKQCMATANDRGSTHCSKQSVFSMSWSGDSLLGVVLPTQGCLCHHLCLMNTGCQKTQTFPFEKKTRK